MSHQNPYEADRENQAVGPDDLTPCPVCGGDEQQACTCEPEFRPLHQAGEDEFARAMADAHFEALLENYASNEAALRTAKRSKELSSLLVDILKDAL